MKKILTMVIAGVLIAAMCFALVGCGDDNKKNDATSATKAPTTAATTAPTSAPTSAATLVPVPQQATLVPQNDATDAPADGDDDINEDGDGNYYGGLDSQSAILKAMDFAGPGYQCVYYDKQYLSNQEAWYIGLQATDGDDDTVYYLYVNADRCIPQTAIPSRGEGSDYDSDDVYAGLTRYEAQIKAIQNLGDTADLGVVSATQGYYQDSVEAWVFHITGAHNQDYVCYVGADFCYFS